MPRKSVAVLGVHPPNRQPGGAERFYAGLTAALCRAGVEAEHADVLCDESSNETIRATYLRCYDLDLSRFDGVISTKAPAYAVRHRNHVCYLQHTMRVFYDLFEHEFPNPSAEMVSARELIQALDTRFLARPNVKARFVISHEVRNRLLRYNGLDSTVVYQESTVTPTAKAGHDFIFLPGRLHRWKRVDLVIQAMRHVARDVPLVISGEGEDGERFRHLAAGDPRIRFVGRVDDGELARLYAHALVVPYFPIREDYGLVVPEAFHSGTPVLTSLDSGEPSRLVHDGQTGRICRPDPEDIGRALTWFVDHPSAARAMGAKAAAWVSDIRWSRVVEALLAALNLVA